MFRGLREEVIRIDHLLDIEPPRLGRRRKLSRLQDLLRGRRQLPQPEPLVDLQELVPQHRVHEVHVPGVDCEAVVHHRHVEDPLAPERPGRQHHVGGVERMDQIRHDPVPLLLEVDPRAFLVPVDEMRVSDRPDAVGVQAPALLQDRKTARGGP